MHDNPDGGYTIEEKQHIKSVLEANKIRQNEFRKNSLIGNTQKHWQQVAEIPSLVYMDLMKKFGDPKKDPDAQNKWKKWLNDIDNRYFRTNGGKV